MKVKIKKKILQTEEREQMAETKTIRWICDAKVTERFSSSELRETRNR